MKTVEKLQATKNLSDLSKLLGYKPKAVSFILYKIPDAEKYESFSINKSGGGVREIKAPVCRLKVLQRRLADLLQNCLEEIYGKHKYGRVLSHGFRRDLSIITNANNHRNKRFVFNIDLKDFFPSINFGRVHGFFIKSNDFRLNPKVATVIAQIACHDNELPQGSPVSPIISNLIGHVLDIRLVRIAKKARCVYSRYADDITFSTREKAFPALIAKETAGGKWGPSDALNDTIVRAGFEMNLNKISMQYETNRQMTTGLVVNKKTNIRAPYYRQTRAMCHSLFRTGNFYIGKEMRWGEPKDSAAPVEGSVNQLRGVLSYIYNVKKHHDDREFRERCDSPTAIHSLFRRFLYFDKFHNLPKPLIFCEGKTDNIYLKCALKSLAADFPSMIDISGADLMWHVDFFKHSQMNKDLMQFSGGTSDFPPLIGNYVKRMSPFLCSGRKFPVILLVDNDSGAKPVFSSARNVTKFKIDGSRDFYHLVENLYLVVLPPIAGELESNIEDCFESSVTSTVLDGKYFSRDNKPLNRDTQYGKQVFAEKVVKAKQASINFDGFKPLLRRLDLAISDFVGNLDSP